MRAGTALFIGSLIFSTHALADEVGHVRGQVADSESAAISNAHIRAIPQTTGVTRYRSQSEMDGSFHFDGVEPGTYTVAVSAQGFREKLIGSVLVQAEHEVDLGEVRLAVTSCDAPGVFCDSISTGPTEPVTDTVFSRGEIRVPLGCTVDIDKGEVTCIGVLDGPPAPSPMRDRSSDFWLNLRSDNHIYLEPRNGARLAEPNSGDANCGGAVLLTHRVRVDGLGPGSDLCLRGNSGRYSHIFFNGEVQPDSKEIVIYHVTRK
jgi:hypothetical protein